MTSRQMGTVAAMVVVLASVSTAAMADQTLTIGKRRALVVSPSAGEGAHPLVFGFHPHGGSSEEAKKLFALEAKWPEAIIVYPQGIPTASCVDLEGKKAGWQGAPGAFGDRDLKFFDELLAKLHKMFSVDDSRVYTMGFSNGATFSYVVWAARPKVVAAIAEAAGRLHAGDLTEPRPALIIAGKDDTVDPFVWQLQSLDAARMIDDANGPGESCGEALSGKACDDKDKGTCTRSGPTAHPIEAFIHCDGHIYPSWATEKIIAFFKAHAGPSAAVPPETAKEKCTDACFKADGRCMKSAHDSGERQTCVKEKDDCVAGCK